MNWTTTITSEQLRDINTLLSQIEYNNLHAGNRERGLEIAALIVALNTGHFEIA